MKTIEKLPIPETYYKLHPFLQEMFVEREFKTKRSNSKNGDFGQEMRIIDGIQYFPMDEKQYINQIHEMSHFVEIDEKRMHIEEFGFNSYDYMNGKIATNLRGIQREARASAFEFNVLEYMKVENLKEHKKK